MSVDGNFDDFISGPHTMLYYFVAFWKTNFKGAKKLKDRF